MLSGLRETVALQEPGREAAAFASLPWCDIFSS